MHGLNKHKIYTKKYVTRVLGAPFMSFTHHDLQKEVSDESEIMIGMLGSKR
jgi:hypothetical protein